MRKLFIALLLLMFYSCAAQEKLPPPKEVPKEYRSDYRDLIKEKRRIDRSLNRQDQWDIILDPIESVPTEISVRSLASESNWGKPVLLPAAVAQRMAQDCTCDVHLKTFDTAGDLDHPDLQEGKERGSNYTTSPTLDDIHGHGTHVAGIAVARNLGMLYPLIQKGLVTHSAEKILGDQGQGSFIWFANAVKTEDEDNKQRIANGQFVVANGSFGGGTTKIGAVEAALKNSTDLGVIYVIAAGNTGQAVNYPGNSEYAITAGSLDQNLKASSFSSRGPELDNAAPGRNIRSTYKNGSYASLSGTSMASPFLSSLVVIAKSRWCNAIPDYKVMRKYLAWIATDLQPEGRDDATGWGIAFVKSILDKDPRNMPGDGPSDPDEPDEPDNPDNPTDPGEEYSLSFTTSKHVMRWKKESWQGYYILQFPEIKVTVTGKGLVETGYDNHLAFINRFFNNRVVVVTDQMSTLDAAWWSGQFLEYVARNSGYNIQVEYLDAIDEQHRKYYATGFDRAQTDAMELGVYSIEKNLPKGPDKTIPPNREYTWVVLATWYADNEVGGGATPKMKFKDFVGYYPIYIQSPKKPTNEQIQNNAPFPGAKLNWVYDVKRY